jgi:hypothetical protein
MINKLGSKTTRDAMVYRSGLKDTLSMDIEEKI